MQCQSPKVKPPVAVAVLSRAGGKGWFSVSAAPEHELSRTSAPSAALLRRRFCDKALVGATPTLHNVSASGVKSSADLLWFESAKSGPKM